MYTRIPFYARIPSARGAVLALGAVVAGLAATSASAQDMALVESAGVVQAAAMHGQGASIAQAKADLGKGFDSLRAGKQARAVQYFDRVIAAFDQGLAADGRQRLCASGSEASVPSGGAVLVDGAVCSAHFGKGYALIDMGRGDLAEAELLKATQMAPGNAHFANEYAELYKSRRDWPAAYALFDKAWAVADKTVGGRDADLAARALRGMGYAKAKMGDLSAAKALLEQSLTFEPTSEAARVELDHIARMDAIGS